MNALELLQKLYLKFHREVGEESEGKILEQVSDFLAEEMGDDKYLAWLELNDPEDYGDLDGFWNSDHE